MFVWHKAESSTAAFKRTSSASRVIASYAALESITEAEWQDEPVITLWLIRSKSNRAHKQPGCAAGDDDDDDDDAYVPVAN